MPMESLNFPISCPRFHPHLGFGELLRRQQQQTAVARQIQAQRVAAVASVVPRPGAGGRNRMGKDGNGFNFQCSCALDGLQFFGLLMVFVFS